MKSKNDIPINWDEILGVDSDEVKDGGFPPLVGIRPSLPQPVSFSLLITMNYPRTTLFRNMLSIRQKDLYTKIFHLTKNTNSVAIKEVFVFEYCKSGHVHLHGTLNYIVPHAFSIEGFISDYVKTYLKYMPAGHRLFKDPYMCSSYQRYRSPSLCVQYKPFGDPYLETWDTYIRKEEFNKISA